MPNWIEGTLKLRGKQKDIKRFIEEGLEASIYYGKIDRIENQVIDYSDDSYLDYTFKNNPHVKGTRRMFIRDCSIFMVEDEGVCCFLIKQAWAFSGENDNLEILIRIADEYNVDIKLYGIEGGAQFCQEVLVRHGNKEEGRPGRVVYDNVIQYEDWDWECPFPEMGG